MLLVGTWKRIPRHVARAGSSEDGWIACRSSAVRMGKPLCWSS